MVHGERVSATRQADPEPTEAPRRRGDRQRHAIVQAVRELLTEKPFAELSVSTISDRAGVARSGFYFYFESKYAVLAHILGEVADELEELTGDFAPRGDDETPAEFAKRMIGSAAVVYAHNDPVMSACNLARGTDAEIREILDRYNDLVIDQIVPVVEAEIGNGTADPVTDDVRGLQVAQCHHVVPGLRDLGDVHDLVFQTLLVEGLVGGVALDAGRLGVDGDRHAMGLLDRRSDGPGGPAIRGPTGCANTTPSG